VDEREAGYNRMLVYRAVYGACRNRLAPYCTPESPESVRADPIRGLRLAHGVTDDPEFPGLVREAVEDAVEGRPPRW
jgi:hypothetical protein